MSKKQKPTKSEKIAAATAKAQAAAKAQAPAPAPAPAPAKAQESMSQRAVQPVVHKSELPVEPAALFLLTDEISVVLYRNFRGAPETVLPELASIAREARAYVEAHNERHTSGWKIAMHRLVDGQCGYRWHLDHYLDPNVKHVYELDFTPDGVIAAFGSAGKGKPADAPMRKFDTFAALEAFVAAGCKDKPIAPPPAPKGPKAPAKPTKTVKGKRVKQVPPQPKSPLAQLAEQASASKQRIKAAVAVIQAVAPKPAKVTAADRKANDRAIAKLKAPVKAVVAAKVNGRGRLVLKTLRK